MIEFYIRVIYFKLSYLLRLKLPIRDELYIIYYELYIMNYKIYNLNREIDH